MQRLVKKLGSGKKIVISSTKFSSNLLDCLLPYSPILFTCLETKINTIINSWCKTDLCRPNVPPNKTPAPSSRFLIFLVSLNCNQNLNLYHDTLMSKLDKKERKGYYKRPKKRFFFFLCFVGGGWEEQALPDCYEN